MRRLAALCTLCVAAITAAQPAIVETRPVDGAAGVDPAAVTELRVTFDRPMRAGSHSWVYAPSPAARDFFPAAGVPRWEDERTAVLPVTLEPGRDYAVGLNSRRFTGFRDAAGVPLPPALLLFSTKEHPAPEGWNAGALETLRGLLATSYSYADRLGIEWDAALDSAAPDLLAAAGPIAFAARLRPLLARADDPHLWLEAGDIRLDTATRRPETQHDHRATAALLRSPERHGGVVLSGLLPGGPERVGYLSVATWRGEASPGEHALAALDRLAESDALVIDVRGNGGGDEAEARRLAARFAERETVYAKHAGVGERRVSVRTVAPAGERYARPVFVLIDGGVQSSCEAFALMMRATGATLIGEPTFGSSGNPVRHELGAGVAVWLPSWVAMNAAGEPFEGVGIAPDVLVRTTDAERRAGRDPALDRAVSLARAIE